MSTLYIFGSGASKCAGLPTTVDALEKILEKADVEKYLNPEGFFTRKAVDKVLKKYEVFLKESRRNGDIEFFLEWLGDVEERAWFCRMVYWYFWDNDHNYEKSKTHQLFYKIMDKDIFKTVISFNYDIVLERALSPEGELNNRPENYWYAQESNKIYIIKPMGSINFMHWPHQYGRPVRDLKHNNNDYYLNDNWCLDENSNMWVFPEYSEPSGTSSEDNFWVVSMKWLYEIFEKNQYFDSLYDNCAEKINTADKIVVIGYAFPTNTSSLDEQVLNEIFDRIKNIQKSLEIELVCGNLKINKPCLVCKKKYQDTYEDIINRINKLFSNKRKLKIFPSEYKTFEKWVLAKAQEKNIAT